MVHWRVQKKSGIAFIQSHEKLCLTFFVLFSVTTFTFECLLCLIPTCHLIILNIREKEALPRQQIVSYIKYCDDVFSFKIFLESGNISMATKSSLNTNELYIFALDDTFSLDLTLEICANLD